MQTMDVRGLTAESGPKKSWEKGNFHPR